MKNKKTIRESAMKDLFTQMEVIEPPPSFTERVMYRISLQKNPYSEIYKPLISRTAWIITGIFVIALIAVAILFSSGETGYLGNYFNLNFNLSLKFEGRFLDNMVQPVIHLFTFSSPVITYIILSVLGMILVFMGEQIWSRRKTMKV